jgi:hypothetical protein
MRFRGLLYFDRYARAIPAGDPGPASPEYARGLVYSLLMLPETWDAEDAGRARTCHGMGRMSETEYHVVDRFICR